MYRSLSTACGILLLLPSVAFAQTADNPCARRNSETTARTNSVVGVPAVEGAAYFVFDLAARAGVAIDLQLPDSTLMGDGLSLVICSNDNRQVYPSQSGLSAALNLADSNPTISLPDGIRVRFASARTGRFHGIVQGIDPASPKIEVTLRRRAVDPAPETDLNNIAVIGGPRSPDSNTSVAVAAGSPKLFKLDATAGEVVRLTLTDPTGNGDPIISVLSATNSENGEVRWNELARNDDYGSTYNSNLVYEIPTSGTYYVAAQAFRDEGTFNLAVSRLPRQALEFPRLAIGVEQQFAINDEHSISPDQAVFAIEPDGQRPRIVKIRSASQVNVELGVRNTLPGIGLRDSFLVVKQLEQSDSSTDGQVIGQQEQSNSSTDGRDEIAFKPVQLDQREYLLRVTSLNSSGNLEQLSIIVE